METIDDEGMTGQLRYGLVAEIAVWALTFPASSSTFPGAQSSPVGLDPARLEGLKAAHLLGLTIFLVAVDGGKDWHHHGHKHNLMANHGDPSLGAASEC